MDEILEQIKQTPLLERIDKAIDMISAMCADGRCPKMSIPVQPTDEDVFIVATLRDAKASLVALDKSLFRECGEWSRKRAQS